MRKKIIIANWKMHLNVSQASLLLHRLQEQIETHYSVETVLAPTMLVLQPLSLQLDRRKFRLAAQDGYFKDEGAYTGEVSFYQLRDLVHYGIVGHSDRRYKIGESLDVISAKVSAAVRNGISPIICVGETKQEHADKETMMAVQDQVTTALSGLTPEEVENVVIAYEPVWALSNGTDYSHHEKPTPSVIGRVTKAIRNNIRHLYGEKAANSVRIVYGGSVCASTAHGLMSTEGVDGLLVGGASLNYMEFKGVVEAAFRVYEEQKEYGEQ